MTLNIATFSNVTGGNALFKALTHPRVGDAARKLLDALRRGGPVAVYDPLGHAEAYANLYSFAEVDVQSVFVQRVEDLSRTVLGREPQVITAVAGCRASTLFVAAFDAERLVQQIRPLLPPHMQVLTLDALRLPDAMLSNPRRYLDPLNFATNFALFREQDGHHTRLVTCNYWHGYGAKDVGLWLCLFDHGGRVLAEWSQALPAASASIVIDSVELRARFGLGAFTGSLFMHVTHIAGHDVVKYALDSYGDAAEVLSCTHDANSWPAEFYAGLPAPRADERVVMWIENSLPVAIPAGAVGLRIMGTDDTRYLQQDIPAFGSHAVDVATLLPDARWPEQIEVCAGKYFVRPRYEVIRRDGRRRIAHANVERTDLAYDPKLAEVTPLLGKGFILPAPILPLARYRSVALPTPMATCQRHLPLAAVIYDADGSEIARHRFGRMARSDMTLLDIDAAVAAAQTSLPSGYGHVELAYDFASGGEADGWLHGLFRYEDRANGHVAETSFGAHVFNTPVVYKNEPQSYTGHPPGLSTRLFLRLGDAPTDAFCHLIYPASAPWHAQSTTELALHDRHGAEIAKQAITIACGGSRLWRYSEMFDEHTRRAAGTGAYVMIRDTTCRLFGYHGLINEGSAFSLDHMFGF